MSTLDESYIEFNGIYLDANFYKNEFLIFSHLVEVIGGLSSISSKKKNDLEQARRYMPKAIAWWLALAGKIGVSSVTELLWVKYPRVCPYCLGNPHKTDKCKQSLNGPQEPQWTALKKLGEAGERPLSISDWQSVFADIYPVFDGEDFQGSFARLTEELGEMAEAIRVREIAPSYFISEAADVFAWLMRVQNLYDMKTQAPDHKTLERWLAEAYPGKCLECGDATCSCPAILDSAFGRMAHEVPEGSFRKSLIPFRESAERFRARELHFHGETWAIKGDDLQSLKSGIDELLVKADIADDRWAFQNKAMMDTLYELRGLNTASAISDELIGRLVAEVQALKPGVRDEVRDMVTGVGSGLLSWIFTLALTGGTGNFH
jgi:hypothetical protein